MGRRILLTYHHQTLLFLFEIFVTPKIPAFYLNLFVKHLRDAQTLYVVNKREFVCVF